MTRVKRWALGVVLLVAVALLALPAVVFAGRGSSAPARSDNAKVGEARAEETVRVERRESFRHTGCSKRTERFSPSSL
jgi:hypothetical protein